MYDIIVLERKGKTMTRYPLNTSAIALCPSNYNIGQRAEFVMRYTATGKTERADNRKATESADLFDIQIKTAKATVCKGTDIAKYIDESKAERYAYARIDCSTAYIMTKAEFVEFLAKFGTKDKASAKNGGGEVIRVKNESLKMLEWLESHAK